MLGGGDVGPDSSPSPFNIPIKSDISNNVSIPGPILQLQVTQPSSSSSQADISLYQNGYQILDIGFKC